jgi:hypothetical protein
MWQIEAKPTWHYFGGKINWFKPMLGGYSKVFAYPTSDISFDVTHDI